MKSIKISIIIPFYNVEEYIAECIGSIMAQTLQDGIECILVDDCSTDRSVQIAENLISKYEGDISFKIIKHQNNKGVSYARNTGIAASEGEYIGFVDSDDYIESSMYMKLLRLLEENPNAQFAACPIYIEKEGTTSFYEGYDFYQNYSMMSIDDYFCLFLKYEIDNFLWNKLFHRSFINILFRENHIEEDYLFFYQNCKPILKQNKTIVLTSVPLYHHRTRKGSLCNQPRTSIYPLFLDQLANHREIISDLKTMGYEELSECLYKQYISLLCHNFFYLLHNKRLKKHRPEDVERYWTDIKRIPLSKIPIKASAIKKHLFVIKFLPFGEHVLYMIKSIKSLFKK